MDVNYNEVYEINGGLYLPFEVTCVEHCNERDEQFNCGWGIWNTCTCQVSFTLQSSVFIHILMFSLFSLLITKKPQLNVSFTRS